MGVIYKQANLFFSCLGVTSNRKKRSEWAKEKEVVKDGEKEKAKAKDVAKDMEEPGRETFAPAVTVDSNVSLDAAFHHLEISLLLKRPATMDLRNSLDS